MNYEQSCMHDEDVEVAPPALLRRERGNRYGSVPGLDDSELADPAEIERGVWKHEFGPLLALPWPGRPHCVRPNLDQDGSIDWGPFGTVDFERHRTSFDKARFKADRIKEQLKDVLILFSIVGERVKTRAKYLVLKYVKMGIIDLDQIADDDMRALARLYLRAKRMRQEIAELREASERRRQRQAEAFLQSW
jgi:hypothetical protein